MLKKIKWLTLASFLLFSFNAFVPGTLGQGTHTHLLVQEVIAGTILDLVERPDPFTFPPVSVFHRDQFNFHTRDNSSENVKLVVRDSRNNGGFKLLLQIQPLEATQKTIQDYEIYAGPTRETYRIYKKKVTLKEREIIGNENLYLVTTDSGGKAYKGVTYSEGALGPVTIVAPFDANGMDLLDFGTYTRYGTNLVTTPIVLMDGTLPEDKGRVGEFSVDLNYALRIKRWQPAGNYEMQFLYTLIDSTE